MNYQLDFQRRQRDQQLNWTVPAALLCSLNSHRRKNCTLIRYPYLFWYDACRGFEAIVFVSLKLISAEVLTNFKGAGNEQLLQS